MSDGPAPQPVGPRTRVTDPDETAPPSHSTDGSGDEGGDDLFPRLPANFGRYVLRRLIGAGGMGSVYLAHDGQLDRDVAIKIPNAAYRTKFKDRFLREARVAATFTHPNLCPVYDAGEIGEYCFLTMPYVEGRPLADFVRGKPLPPKGVVALVRQLALAMQEAHDKGVVHRDLKPANIIITPKKQPVIMDFGLAVRTTATADPRLTQEGMVMGTPSYMPPEQVNGDVAAIGPASDVYALGVILYELLTGHVPFKGSYGALIGQIVSSRPEPPSRVRPELDRALDAVCLKALAKRPEDRFHSMAEFAAALDKVLHGETPHVGAIAEVLRLAPEEAHGPAPELTPLPAAPPKPAPRRDPAAGERRRRKRLRRRLTVGLATAGVFVSLAALGYGVYKFAFAGRLDTAVLASVDRLRGGQGVRADETNLEEVKTRPDRFKPDTLTAVGRFLILERGDWDGGSAVLAHLTSGAWRDAAAWERKKPANPNDQIDAGNAWWQVAGRETGPRRGELLWRAGEWFEAARAQNAPLPPETDQRFTAVRGQPQPRGWDDLSGVPGDDKSYTRPVPQFWRAKGRCEANSSRGWHMVIGRTDRPPALTVRIDGEGVVHVTHGGDTDKHTPSFVHKAGTVNDLVVLVVGGTAEVFVNNYLVRREIALPEFETRTLGRCTVGRYSSFADVNYFAAAPADGVAGLAQRLIAAR
jgi:predicted Ser/Thr protein kinase